MTTPQKHTPTPWRATGMLHGRGLKCRLVAQDGTTVGQAVTPEVAAFIVLAVNNHERLLEAARFTLSVMKANHDDVELSERMAIEKLIAAIAAATLADVPSA